MYKKFAVLTACVAASALSLAVTVQAAEDAEGGSAKGAVTDRAAHCQAQAANRSLSGDKKTEYLNNCGKSAMSAATAPKREGKLSAN